MDPTWTAMIIFYCLLFSVALLLFVCLCIMCKRKKRRTQDVGRILRGAATIESRLQLTRNRSDSNACPVSDGDPESGNNPTTESSGDAPAIHVSGQTNGGFIPDTAALPPEYEEALKSKYLKVYHPIYPSLPPSEAATSSTVGYHEESEVRSISGESPPPPYDTVVCRNNINAVGYFS